MRKLRFLFLEPFYGGSHRDFADGLIAHSRHAIDLITLPDRFWKWRMRGAALYLAARIDHPERYDGLILSSLMSLPDLKALWKASCPPALVYFHENQLSYPLSPGERMDYQYGFTNIATALCADRLLFNSAFHMNAFMQALPAFIRMMPDCRPVWVPRAIAAKAAVAHPGCHFKAAAADFRKRLDEPPLIIWNHRWEHDKNPAAFFQALASVRSQGVDFSVALLGERYENAPAVFASARSLLGDRLMHSGYVDSRQAYYQWLARGRIVISTALQENFGIAVIEAIRHGCLPLLPDRLSYPEILPQAFHADFLYGSQEELVAKLMRLIRDGDGLADRAAALAEAMGMHAWENAIAGFDRELAALASGAAR